MPLLFFPKTSGPRRGDKRPRLGRRGAVSLVVVFLFFAFSGLGLSVIFLTQIHLKINARRKQSTILEYASENGIKQGFQDIIEIIRSSPALAEITEERMVSLTEDPETGFPPILEDALGDVFPRSVEGSWEAERWNSQATWALRRAEDHGLYCRIVTDLRIESEGRVSGKRPRRMSILDANLSFLAGRIPLPCLPLLVGREMDPQSRENFLESNDITLLNRPGNVPVPRPIIGGGEVMPEDAIPLTAKALKIRIFHPQDMSTSSLRQALGLEASNAPVPDGVYLVRDDLGLGGIFVQGDLDEMTTAIEGDYQVIAFEMTAGTWILRFSPSLGRTEFQTPGDSITYDLVPLGIIIVNGRISSLCGGVIGLDGEIEPVADEEIPSILGGVSLTIVASEKITLTSHLILQNVHWQEGFPYIKDTTSQLIVFSTGKDTVSGEEREGGIEVSGEAPSGMRIHASLTAADGGFEISGLGKDVEILGGLQTVDYSGNGNSLTIRPDERIPNGFLPENAPLTADARVTVTALKIVNWKEY